MDGKPEKKNTQWGLTKECCRAGAGWSGPRSEGTKKEEKLPTPEEGRKSDSWVEEFSGEAKGAFSLQLPWGEKKIWPSKHRPKKSPSHRGKDNGPRAVTTLKKLKNNWKKKRNEQREEQKERRKSFEGDQTPHVGKDDYSKEKKKEPRKNGNEHETPRSSKKKSPKKKWRCGGGGGTGGGRAKPAPKTKTPSVAIGKVISGRAYWKNEM